MPTNRKVAFANGEIYHVFNRGVEKRTTFTDAREFKRAMQLLKYYRFVNPPVRFSHFNRLDKEAEAFAQERLNKNQRHADILAYCFMPNHFHFLLRQINNHGISKFLANFANSYTKYFNMKHSRIGPLFQGLFKAVHVANDEQFVHLVRYIHINPVIAFMIGVNALESFPWSSHRIYLGKEDLDFVEKQTVLNLFRSTEAYKKFVLDQVDYKKSIEKISHLLLEQ